MERCLFRVSVRVLLVACCGVAWAGPPVYRPGREFRSLNTDAYEIAVQKNGRLDVTLVSGAPVFSNVFPMVQLEGQDGPRPMSVDGRWSARAEAAGPLGQGQGMRLQKKECIWSIHAYPAKPYLAVQVVYINRTMRPVRVRALMPWCVGEPKSGAFTLGEGTAATRFLGGGDAPELSEGAVESAWHLAAANPLNGRVLVAGFVTHDKAETFVRVDAMREAQDAFALFRAECRYDPPVTLDPGEQLASEVLYLSLAERDPLAGLERFARHAAAFTGSEGRAAFVPHGWDSRQSRYASNVDEDDLLTELDAAARRLKRYGWTHFAVGDGWARPGAWWEPDPARFPHGMRWLAGQIHARGMTAGIRLNPFLVPRASTLAKDHPEWLLDAPAGQDDAMALLDAALPEVREHVLALVARVTQTWDFDAVDIGRAPGQILAAGDAAGPGRTRVEILHAAMGALREAMGPRKVLVSETLHPALAPYADVMNVAAGEAPAAGAQRFYLAPYLTIPRVGTADFARQSTGLPENPSIDSPKDIHGDLAWFTASALLGSAIQIGDAYTDLAEHQIEILRRLLPVPRKPARPIDLFTNPTPRVWSLPIESAIGRWHVVALFNWEAGETQEIYVDFARLGLAADAYYTVYDFWDDRYHGTARGGLSVAVGPGRVRLFGLRAYLGRPMFLSTDRHFTQGATDFTGLSWDAAQQSLAGVFEGVEDTDYVIGVLVPESYSVEGFEGSVDGGKWTLEGRHLRLFLHCTEVAEVTWRLRFAKV